MTTEREALERVRDAFSFMPALNGAYAHPTIAEIVEEVEDALGACMPAVHAALAPPESQDRELLRRAEAWLVDEDDDSPCRLVDIDEARALIEALRKIAATRVELEEALERGDFDLIEDDYEDDLDWQLADLGEDEDDVWTVQVNDLVGGWIVTDYPYPLSEHDHRPDGDSGRRGYVIAECSGEIDARRIAALLNDDDLETVSDVDAAAAVTDEARAAMAAHAAEQRAKFVAKGWISE